MSLLVLLNKVYKYEPEVCSGYHYVSVIAFGFGITAILNLLRAVAYRCNIWNMSRRDEIKKLNHFKLDKKCSLEIIACRIWFLARIKHPLK